MIGVATGWLVVCFVAYCVGRDALNLHLAQVQTLVFLKLVFTGQATIYIVREHHHLWASMPSAWMITGTVADVLIVCALATTGTLMTAIS